MNITVYLGSASPKKEMYLERVRELGQWIAASGDTLIYGGSRVGLMGDLASAAVEAGGRVIGVEPQFLVDACLQHEGITELVVTADMHERKKKMAELGDAFIAFPGGTGTLEEISEVISHLRMGIHGKPCILYSLEGFYEPLKEMFARMMQEEFLPEEGVEGLYFAESLAEIRQIIAEYRKR